MSTFLAVLLAIYVIGIVAFLVFWRDKCPPDNWFQLAVTTLAWPVMGCVVVYCLYIRKDSL